MKISNVFWLVVVVLIVFGVWQLSKTTTAVPTVAQVGEHCGGNKADALQCVSGAHCAPTPGSHLPFGDVGGVCVAN